jgi:hypothetical protein
VERLEGEMRNSVGLAAAISLLPIAFLPIQAQQKGTPAPRVEVCKLIPKPEVRKFLPWHDVVDRMAVEDEPVGATGSACEFATVRVQVLTWTPSLIESARKSGPLETIAGVGDEAYFHNNRDRYAELYVRVGSRILTLQASADGKMAEVKAKTIELAKVYVTKLR